MNLARTGFQLRPDITVTEGHEVVAILVAKWKRLETDKPNFGVSSADAYQMNAYAGRYRCIRLTLVYPASYNHPPGRVTKFVLMTQRSAELEVLVVNIRELAFGSGMLEGFDKILGSKEDVIRTARVRQGECRSRRTIWIRDEVSLRGVGFIGASAIVDRPEWGRATAPRHQSTRSPLSASFRFSRSSNRRCALSYLGVPGHSRRS